MFGTQFCEFLKYLYDIKDCNKIQRVIRVRVRGQRSTFGIDGLNKLPGSEVRTAVF